MKYYIIVIIIVLMILILLSSKNKKPKYQYKAKGSLFTKNEFNFFKELNKAIDEKSGLVIFSKVRLADIIEPKNHDSTWQAHFNKICSKHVDFILCDTKTYTPQLIIELDDKSHEKADRQERDAFVDQSLGQAGIPIIHTRNSEGLKEKIEKALSPTL